MPPRKKKRATTAASTATVQSPALVEELQVTDDPDWAEGDFTLISSDAVRFRIHSYHLFSASAVFRDAGSHDHDETSASIAFTDPEIESADTIRAFLVVSTTGELAIPPKPIKPLVALLRFCLKYDAARVRLTIFNAIDALDEKLSSYEVFMIGAIAERPSLCYTALARKSVRWPVTNTTTAQSITEPGSYRTTYNPRGFPYEMWLQMPPAYSWALTRAWIPGRHEGVDQRFKELLEVALKYESPEVTAASESQPARVEGVRSGSVSPSPS